MDTVNVNNAYNDDCPDVCPRCGKYTYELVTGHVEWTENAKFIEQTWLCSACGLTESMVIV